MTIEMPLRLLSIQIHLVETLEPDPDVPLNLATAVVNVYQRGGYASIIDYSQPPPPPSLSESQSVFIKALFTR